jgi:hypothetical protein
VNKKEVSSPLIFTERPVPEVIYSELGCNIKENIIIPYNKKNLSDLITGQQFPNDGPDPYGMSGGGLWYIPADGNGSTRKKLVGILTEWFDKNYLIATKIDVFTEIIRTEYKLNIEESEYVRCVMMP